METVIEPSTLARIVPEGTGFSIERIARPHFGSGELMSEEVILDSVYRNGGNGVSRNNEQLLITTELPYAGSILFESKNPGIGTVDSSGLVRSVANGEVDILVTVDATKVRVKHTSIVTADGVIQSWLRYADGTLGKAIVEDTAAKRRESNAKNVFTSMYHSTGVYVRNTNLWLDVDLTCWPVRNVTQNTSRYLGSLVTRKHLIQAWHARSAVGSTLRFVTAENEIVERKIIGSVKVGQVDLQLVTLDEEVPEGVTPCQVFPPEVEHCIKYIDLPIVAGDQETKLLSRTATHYGKMQTNDVEVGAFIAHYPSEDPLYLDVTEDIIVGDSGSPLWMVLDGKLIAMGAHSTSLSFVCISSVVDIINTMMAGQPGGYELDTVDLSEYASFAQ